MGYYKIKIKELRRKICTTRDKSKRAYYKRLIKGYKKVIKDKTRRD